MNIPEWDANKVLPPIHPEAPEGQEHDRLYRAPYAVPLAEFIGRFAGTLERMDLVQRFLEYRATLHQAGITEGFQWINGSFVENIEEGSRMRPPDDIDVVTFYYTNEDANPNFEELFNPRITKQDFRVDAYGIEIDQPLDVSTVTTIGHLHSLWSHRRGDDIWKGYIQTDLDPEEDNPAQRTLDVMRKIIEERQEQI